MSVAARTSARSDVVPSTIFLGLDVHKESVTIAVLPSDAAAPTHVDKLAYDLKKLRCYLERLGPAATLRACYEASGAGYVLQRELATLGDRLYGDRAVADSHETRRPTHARQVRCVTARAPVPRR